MGLGNEISCVPTNDSSLSEATQIALYGVTRVLASVGRAFVCLDSDFRIVHASYLLDDLLGSGISRAFAGRGIEELLGADLFGTGGPLRKALLEGQRREGWRATLQFKDTASRLVSITAAPVVHESSNICEPHSQAPRKVTGTPLSCQGWPSSTTPWEAEMPTMLP
jgi:hypothetical protein